MAEEYLLRSQLCEGSLLCRSFWYGKYLQALPPSSEPGGGASQQELLLMGLQSSLSVGVHQLLLGDTHTSPLPGLLRVDGTLELAVIGSHLQEDISRADLSSMAAKCACMSEQAGRQLAGGGGALHREYHYQWTRSPQVFLRCLEELSAGQCHASLLVACAALEAALGDVYLTVSGAQRTPFLMKDLLTTPELERTFGVVLVSVVRCLVGPPAGLNLRNLLWHGFLSPSELPLKYGYFLFAVVATLGRVMQRLAVAHRPYVSWPQALAMEGVFDGVQENELAVVAELFACSYVVLPSMLPLWHCALESLHRRRFDRFLVLMLPALEHAVRRVFACVNGCPERSITAESGALYTTFDEMLSPVLPDGAGNCLEEELPCFLVTPPELLRDLLERPEGPRLRDRLSHGQADFEDIPQTLANHVLCVAVVLAAHYALDRHVLERSPVSVCVAVSRRYVSLFHPVSLLKGELLQLLSLAEVLPAGEPPVSLAATTAHLLALLLPSHTAELVLTPGLLVELVGSVWQQLLRPPPSSCYTVKTKW